MNYDNHRYRERTIYVITSDIRYDSSYSGNKNGAMDNFIMNYRLQLNNWPTIGLGPYSLGKPAHPKAPLTTLRYLLNPSWPNHGLLL